MDLNLLIAFDALYRTRSVTRAAREQGVTQSAMSHTLRRLRDELGDPLFVRGRGGMLPTPVADALAQPVRAGLGILERAVDDPGAFDPATSTRTFRLMTADLVEVLTVPALLEYLSAHAPHVRLEIAPPGVGRESELLASGTVDVALGVPRELAPDVLVRRLYTETFACLVHRDHPDVTDALDLDTYASLPHAFISPGGSGPGVVDHALAARGMERHIALRTPNFLVAPWVVSRSNLIVTAPRRLCEHMVQAFPLRLVECPVELPSFDMLMAWHPRMHADAGHRWLRERLVALTQAM